MHLQPFYKLFHKHHHKYKSPEPFDDMCIHPIEAIGYYCILYAPPLLFRCHVYAFVGYMVLMGLCGVLDHSGGHMYTYNTHTYTLFRDTHIHTHTHTHTHAHTQTHTHTHTVGVSLSLPGYNTADHDLHHEAFDVNFAFPFVAMDVLHGTQDHDTHGKTCAR
jgi:Fatty acid hydroxylase superfamily